MNHFLCWVLSSGSVRCDGPLASLRAGRELCRECDHCESLTDTDWTGTGGTTVQYSLYTPLHIMLTQHSSPSSNTFSEEYRLRERSSRRTVLDCVKVRGWGEDQPCTWPSERVLARWCTGEVYTGTCTAARWSEWCRKHRPLPLAYTLHTNYPDHGDLGQSSARRETKTSDWLDSVFPWLTRTLPTLYRLSYPEKISNSKQFLLSYILSFQHFCIRLG